MVDQNEQILKMIAEVNKRSAEIAKLERPNWQTNMSFPGIEGNANSAINLNVVADTKQLIKVAAVVLANKRQFTDAAKELGVKAKFSYGGFTTEEWLHDIKLRLDKVQLGAKRKKLEVMQSRLEKIITPELRAKMELDAISAELNEEE